MKYKYFIGKKLLCEANEQINFSEHFPSIKEVKIKEATRKKKVEEPSNEPVADKPISSGDSNSTLKEHDKEE